MTKETNKIHPFNSPIECGLRCLVLLEHAFPIKYDLQRLVHYDYLLVHSGDAGGPKSIHPATPYRSGEVLIKRQMLEHGLFLMMSRDLIVRQYDTSGIIYIASDIATPFLDNLQSRYVKQLKDRAAWVIKIFDAYDEKKLKKFFHKNLDRWGGEFEKAALLKHMDL
ncbi:MAG: ABC-three component system middle component 2 [Chlorobiaceae bacterium]